MGRGGGNGSGPGGSGGGGSGGGIFLHADSVSLAGSVLDVSGGAGGLGAIGPGGGGGGRILILANLYDHTGGFRLDGGGLRLAAVDALRRPYWQATTLAKPSRLSRAPASRIRDRIEFIDRG